MTDLPKVSRRLLLHRAATAASVMALALPLRAALSADAPPELKEDDPAAKALKYVADAKRAQGAKTGSTCLSCALYTGAPGAGAGPCQIFPGKLVKAAGWCTSWAPQM